MPLAKLQDTEQSRLYYDDYLTKYLPRIMSRRKPRLSFVDGSIVPTMMDLPIAADRMQGLVSTDFGQAAEVGESLDLPIVDVNLEEVNFKVWAFGSQATENFRQSMAADLATANGHPAPRQLLDRKLMIVIESIQKRINDAIAYGRGSANGFLNDPDVPVSDQSLFNPYSNTTTDTQLIDFFGKEFTSISTGTLQEQPEMENAPLCALLPPSLYDLIVRRKLSDSDKNVYTWLLENIPELVSIRKINKLNATSLEAAGIETPGDNVNRMVVYPMDDMVVNVHMSLPFPLPTEYRAGTYYMPTVQAVSQVVWEQPLYARYVQFAKASGD